MITRWYVGACLVGLALGGGLLAGGACKRESAAPEGGSAAPGTGAGAAPAAGAAELPLPEMDLGALPLVLETKLGAARREALRVPNDVGKVADLGALCYVHGFPQAAVVCFERVAQLAPQESQWLYALGLAHARAGNPAQAKAAYEKTLALNADYKPARTRLAALLMETDRARAREFFEAALAEDAADVVGHAGLGLCLVAENKLDEAQGHFLRALKTAPHYGPAHMGLAAVLEARGETTEAAARRRRAGQDTQIRPLIDPMEGTLLVRGYDLEALLEAAEAQAERKQFSLAERLLNEAIDVDTSGVRARTQLADVLAQQGKLDDAVREFERVLSLPDGKDYAPAKCKLAFAMVLKKDFDRAEQLLRGVLDKNPADEEALRRFCTLAMARGTPDAGVAVIKAALAAQPQNGDLHLAASGWLQQLDQEAEARAALTKAVELDPELVAARHALGLYLFRAGDVAGARAQFAAALRTDPKYLAARLALRDLLTIAKDYAALEQLLRDGLQVMPDRPELANSLAWLLATCADATRRKPEEAIQWAEKACAATNHRDDTMLDTLAAAYAAAGRFEDARKWIGEALKIAQAANRPDDIRDYLAHQALFEAGKPYFESP